MVVQENSKIIIKEEWDYNLPEGILLSDNEIRNNFNQTLSTKINYIIFSLLHNKEEYEIIINVPMKYKNLFKTLIYFYNGLFKGKYKVNFIVDIDLIEINEHTINILNY